MKASGLYPWHCFRWLHAIVSIRVRKAYNNLQREKKEEFQGNNFLPRQLAPIKTVIFQTSLIL